MLMPKGVYVRTAKHIYIRTPEIRAKNSLALKGRKLSQEQRRKISLAQIGKKLSDTHKRNISIALLGNQNSRGLNMENDSPNWKDGKASYVAKHARIYRRFGKADCCENPKCLKKSERFDWATISGKHLPDRRDWIKLCKSCHSRFDIGNKINRIKYVDLFKKESM
jgi:hypothetical protein